AIKYSPQGGEIRVDIERREDVAEVSVTDPGIGLGGREAEALFERYGRGEAALEHGITGHGLGLFISRQIVEAHGGLIYARGLKEGTCFTFTLPLSPSSSTS
ncbi:MAG TPA: sensor histidine kinase, partial [Chloroflexota bacterium]